jgi:hypothetical protein
MFEKLLNSAFDAGADVFVYMNGFGNPLRGRVQDIEGEYFTLFQNGKAGTVLWAFRLSDVLSCGLLVGPPQEVVRATVNAESLSAEALAEGRDEIDFDEE